MTDDDDDRLIGPGGDDRTDGYLWDRSGAVDSDIAELERILQPARYRPRAQRDDQAPRRAGDVVADLRALNFRTDSARTYRSLFALAALLMLTFGISLLMLRSGGSKSHQGGSLAANDPWSVVALRGAPRINARPIENAALLAAGSWIETDDQSSASVRVADIGTLELSPQTRLGLVRTSPNEHRMDLQFGRIEAFILAPQRMFIVDTPLAAAVDLGCEYVLEVDRADGSALLRVTMGWVAFEEDGRSVQIPRDGMCRTHPGVGTGTPHYADAPSALIGALESFDREPDDADSLSVILESARERDSLTLWHLLDRAAPALRERIAQRLAEIEPPPAGVTIEGIIDNDQAMRRAWFESLPWSVTW